MRLDGIQPRHVRFGFSVARECLRAIAVMLYPAAHAEQMPWIRDARRRLPRDMRAQMEHFRFFFSPRTELFTRAWPESKNEAFEVEVRTLHANMEIYRDAVVRRLNGARLIDASELRAMARPEWYRAAVSDYVRRHPQHRAMLKQFVASPKASCDAFCAMLSAFHDRVVEPTWGSIHARLLADVAVRRRVFRINGLVALLRTLSPDIRAVHTPHGAAIDLPFGTTQLRLNERGRIVLVPSFFCWPHIEPIVLKAASGVRSVIAYPLPPLPAKVAKIPDVDKIATLCAGLGDVVRLRMLELLNGRELSTRELAGYLKRSEPFVSRHLQRLLKAQLLERRRSGYFVMYRLRRDTLQRVVDALTVAASP